MKFSGRGLQIERLSLPRLAWLLVALVMFWHLCYITSSDEYRYRVIASDGAGYYAYLPAVFIYHDYEFKFCVPGHPSKVNNPAAEHGLFMNVTKDGKAINKYFIGTAILQLPFFLTAYGVAPAFGHHANGYDFPFQLSVALAAIFYTLLGLEQIRRLLNKKGIPEYIQALVILLLFLGTNLYHYALDEPSMSHAYSFGIIALFLNQSHNVFHSQNRRAIIWSILILALIVLVRPVNGMVVFALPLIAGSWQNFVDGLRFIFRNTRMLFIGAGGAISLLFLQLLMYKLTVGTWFADSYSGEYFDVTRAQIGNVLFSWRKGWFIYTPLMIFAVAGVFFLRSWFERIAFSTFLLLNVWMISSWQHWEYGGSLGMRPMIDTYAVMSIPFAFFLASVLKKWRWIIAAPFLLFVVVLNLVQHFQYKAGIMPYDEMTAQRYQKIFFRTNPLYTCIYDPMMRKLHTVPYDAVIFASLSETFEGDTSRGLNGRTGITSEKSFEGKYSIKLDKDKYTSALCVSLDTLIPDSLQARTWVVVKAKIFLEEKLMTPKMAMSFRNPEGEYLFDAHPLFYKVDEIGAWQDYRYAVKYPIPNGINNEVCCFLLHDDGSVAYADNMTIEFWVEPKHQ